MRYFLYESNVYRIINVYSRVFSHVLIPVVLFQDLQEAEHAALLVEVGVFLEMLVDTFSQRFGFEGFEDALRHEFLHADFSF